MAVKWVVVAVAVYWQVPWDGAQEMPLQQERTWDPVLQGVPMRCEMHQTSWLRCAPVQTQGPSSVFVSVSDFFFSCVISVSFYHMMTTGHSFYVHFPGQRRLASARMSTFYILLMLRMMEAVVTIGVTWRAKLQLNRLHQRTTLQLFTGQMPYLSPVKPTNQPHDAAGKHYTFLLLWFCWLADICFLLL